MEMGKFDAISPDKISGRVNFGSRFDADEADENCIRLTEARRMFSNILSSYQ